VISGRKYDDDDVAIPGCGFGYDFDDIGNRKSSTITSTSTSTSTIETTYDPNTLNQYETRTVPGIIPVIGTANADTVVKIHRKSLGDGPAAFIVPDRTGNRFHADIAVDNSNGPVTEELDVYCHKEVAGPPAQEIAAKASRTVTVPGSPEEFHYDEDGNLTSDGLWTYTWDAENRLISAESGMGVPPMSRQRLEFAYDYMGRRVSKTVYPWDSNIDDYSQTPVTFCKFVYDGWNLVATFDASNTLLQSYLWGESHQYHPRGWTSH
jgi:YD repeat-containing protein